MEEVKFLADEDIKSAIIDGVRSRLPDLDLVRIQDAGLRTARDPVILEFAASENRIVLSHDVGTMETHALARLIAAEPMPGLLLIDQGFPIGRAIDEIVLIAECSSLSEWKDQIFRLPL